MKKSEHLLSNYKAERVCEIKIRISEGRWSLVKKKVNSFRCIPSSQSIPIFKGKRPGYKFWFEVKNSRGELIYRNTMLNPLKRKLMVLNED